MDEETIQATADEIRRVLDCMGLPVKMIDGGWSPRLVWFNVAPANGTSLDVVRLTGGVLSGVLETSVKVLRRGAVAMIVVTRAEYGANRDA